MSVTSISEVHGQSPGQGVGGKLGKVPLRLKVFSTMDSGHPKEGQNGAVLAVLQTVQYPQKSAQVS